MQKQWVVSGQMWNGSVVEGGGVPIVILHGWGRSSREWVEIGRELSRVTGRALYCLDLPGFGGSSLPKVQNIEEYAELLIGWMDYLKIERIDLVGHSLGGRVGIVLGALRGDRLGKLILIDAAGVRPRSVKRILLKGIAKMFVWVPRGVRRQIVGGVMDEDYRRTPELRELYRAVVKTDLAPLLFQIKCQTMVIWGEKDPILPLSLTKTYRARIELCKIRVAWEAGHDPHLSHPRELTRILEEVWI